MSKFKIDIGDGQKLTITQNISDIKKGIKQGDLSRISGYMGNDVGIHTGSNSKTVGRHNEPFGKDKKWLHKKMHHLIWR